MHANVESSFQRRLIASLRQHWRGWLLLALLALLYLLAGLGISGEHGAQARHERAAPASAEAFTRVPKIADPLKVKAIAPADALAINAAIPIAGGPNPAAEPFVFRGKDKLARERAIACLASAIYYEAALESEAGRRAVAQVVLNRVRHPAYPTSICGVVFEGSQRLTGCQFSFTCDGSLIRTPIPSLWRQARTIAEEAIGGKVFAPVGHATHYHANYVVPYWSDSLLKSAEIGTHIFYRWTGGWGRPRAFVQRHALIEPDVARLGRRTLLAPEEAAEIGEDKDALEELAALLAEEEAAAAGEVAGKEGRKSPDSFSDAVIRRYEPLSKSEVTAALDRQAKGSDAGSASHRWAMSGIDEGSDREPLGKRP